MAVGVDPPRPRLRLPGSPLTRRPADVWVALARGYRRNRRRVLGHGRWEWGRRRQLKGLFRLGDQLHAIAGTPAVVSAWIAESRSASSDFPSDIRITSVLRSGVGGPSPTAASLRHAYMLVPVVPRCLGARLVLAAGAHDREGDERCYHRHPCLHRAIAPSCRDPDRWLLGSRRPPIAPASNRASASVEFLLAADVHAPFTRATNRAAGSDRVGSTLPTTGTPNVVVGVPSGPRPTPRRM